MPFPPELLQWVDIGGRGLIVLLLLGLWFDLRQVRFSLRDLKADITPRVTALEQLHMGAGHHQRSHAAHAGD